VNPNRETLMDDVSPLPAVDVGEIFGMLDYLDDEGGRTDVYALASDLNLEIDDLLPIIKAAELLQFVKIEEGDLILTELGKSVLTGDENKRKLIFKKSLKKLPIFKKLIELLLNAPDKTIDKNDLLVILQQEMRETEAKNMLKTAINLGRYAELIGYNPEEKEIYLDELGEE
jgi:NitT/TauT family transport system ATP-binding protein